MSRLIASSERRNSPRFPGAGVAKIDVVDKLGRAVASLDDATILDISAGGLALCSRFGVSEGMVLRIACKDDEQDRDSFEVRVLSNLLMPSDARLFKLRCKLTLGAIPTALAR